MTGLVYFIKMKGLVTSKFRVNLFHIQDQDCRIGKKESSQLSLKKLYHKNICKLVRLKKKKLKN